MANWYWSDLFIRHKDEEKLKSLYEKIEESTKKNQMENGFGTRWLGNIVLYFGLGTIDEGKNTDIRCRGELSDIEFMGGEITIQTRTANTEMNCIWKRLLEKELPDAEVVFWAEGPDDRYSATNDPDGKGKFVLDAIGMDCEFESNPAMEKQDFVETLQKILGGVKEDDPEKLIEMLRNGDYEYEAYPIQFVEDWKKVAEDELSDWLECVEMANLSVPKKEEKTE